LKRKYPNRPILAVGGIVYINGRLLLVKRKNPPDKGTWSIPGGVVKTGEALIDAVKREIKEECNIDVQNGTPLLIVDKIYRNGKEILYQYSIIDFIFNSFKGNLVPGTDALSARFLELSSIKKMDVSESILDLINILKSSEERKIHYRIFDKEFFR